MPLRKKIAGEATMVETGTVATVESRNDKSPPNSPAAKNKWRGRRGALQRSTSQIIREESQRLPATQEIEKEKNVWLLPLPLSIEVIILATIVTRRFVLLQGILMVLVAKMANVVFPWVICILTSKDTTTLIQGVTSYHRLLMKETKALLDGGKLRMAGAGAAYQYIDTTKSIVSYVWRIRTSDMNKNAAEQHAYARQRFEKYRDIARGSIHKLQTR